MSANENTSRQTITIEGGKPWGFRIVGGANMNIPLQIQQVLSSKAKDAGIMREDRIVEINGHVTTSLSHDDAKQLIVDSGNTLKLVVERSATASSENQTPTKPLNEPQKKVEIKPKISLNDDTSDEKLGRGITNESETTKSTDQKKPLVDDNSGLSHSSEIKSPFLKNLIATGNTGTDNPKEETFVKVKPPTATYTPTRPTSDTTDLPTSPTATTTKDPNEKSTMSQHPHALAKMCHACKDKIEDSSFISASDKFYHKPHFCCSHCGVTLVGKAYFEDRDKKISCQQCINKGGGDHCKVCNKPIHGSFLTVGKDSYHEDCFKCAACKKNLKNEPFIFSEGKPKCERCYEESESTYCVKCNKPIKAGESFVEVENGNCHSKCFTCKICKSILTSFKMRDGYAICPKH